MKIIKYRRNRRQIFFAIVLLFSVCLLFSGTFSVSAMSERGEKVLNPDFDSALVEKWTQELRGNAEKTPVLGDFKTSQNNNAKVGTWSWRDGVICYTESYASLPWFNNGHAGIVAVAPYYYSTVEANPNSGVSAIYGSWDVRFTGIVYQVGPLATTVLQDQQAAQWACNQIGKPYAFPIMLTNRSKFYCSHLVYAAYLDTCGVNLDTLAWPGFIHPDELLNTNNVGIIYSRIP